MRLGAIVILICFGVSASKAHAAKFNWDAFDEVTSASECLALQSQCAERCRTEATWLAARIWQKPSGAIGADKLIVESSKQSVYPIVKPPPIVVKRGSSLRKVKGEKRLTWQQKRKQRK